MKPIESKNILQNDKGSALLLVMIVMAALTLISLSSVNTTTVEYQIVRNERIYVDNFYKAESAALEGTRMLEIQSDDALSERDQDWLELYDEDQDVLDTDNWGSAVASSSSDQVSGDSSGDTDAIYEVKDKGVAYGASLDMTAPDNMYDYASRGCGYSENGKVIIEVGFKMRH